jgi:hypothetical protein
MPPTRLPSIWLIAALSFSVHSATTLARISFMYNMKAFSGFLMCGFFLSEKKKTQSIVEQQLGVDLSHTFKVFIMITD